MITTFTKQNAPVMAIAPMGGAFPAFPGMATLPAVPAAAVITGPMPALFNANPNLAGTYTSPMGTPMTVALVGVSTNFPRPIYFLASNPNVAPGTFQVVNQLPPPVGAVPVSASFTGNTLSIPNTAAFQQLTGSTASGLRREKPQHTRFKAAPAFKKRYYKRR
jgi:hypothetical protein